jgi:hypothetical protein
MDINGLVNHPRLDTRGLGSVSPQLNSSTDSTRSQIPADSLPHYPQSYTYQDHDELHTAYSSRPHYQNHPDQPSLSSAKRQLSSSSYPAPPPKRRPLDVARENGKSIPARRRALQACEAFRTKKSKCDNERPSCGSCVQHAIECVYKGAPFVPVYTLLRVSLR